MSNIKPRRIKRPRIGRQSRSLPEQLTWGLALVLVLLVWTYLSYLLLCDAPRQARQLSSDQLAELEHSERFLSLTRDELVRSVRELRLANDSHRQAAEQAQTALDQLYEEHAKLNRQVHFFRQLFGAADGLIEIGDLTLERHDDRQFSYNFRLTNTDDQRSSEDRLEGEVRIQVSGQGENGMQYLDLAEISDPERNAHAMRFRNFQEVRGRLRLPSRFVPAEFLVIVIPSDHRTPGAHRIFDWVWSPAGDDD